MSAGNTYEAALTLDAEASSREQKFSDKDRWRLNSSQRDCKKSEQPEPPAPFDVTHNHQIASEQATGI